jgi:hypothetical protein
MKETILLALIILLVSCSLETSDKLINGFTKPVEKVSVTTYKIGIDSESIQTIDTISIVDKYYNNNNQIKQRIETYLFDNEKMEIDYIYNERNKIKKEIIKLSFDTSTLNYLYKDTLLIEANVSTIASEFKFDQNSNYKYLNDKLNEVSTRRIFVSTESNDTLKNELELEIYNNNGFVKEDKYTNYLYPKRSQTITYNYKNSELDRSLKFNSYDSLVSTSTYKYKVDRFNNWVEKSIFENGTISYLKKRKIEYK